jgi:uncharacterized membrane protein (UPF0127 family)
MPNNAIARTASAPKRAALLPAAFCALSVALLVAGILTPNAVRTSMIVHGYTYHLEIAASPAAQAKGLGNRLSMSAHHGMLFFNLYPSRECFWMKDMYFPLDIVWLNGTKQIVQVRSDVRPDSFPNTYCAPSGLAQYVIELHAGEAVRAGIAPGQVLQF